MRNKELHEQYKIVTKDILNLIVSLLTEKKLKTFMSRKIVWKSSDDNLFEPREEMENRLSLLVLQAEEQIKKLPSAASLLSTFEDDKILQPHINAIVGTNHGRSNFTAIRSINLIAWKMISQTNNLEYIDSLFESIYENVERDFYSDQIIETRIFPVLGLSVEEEFELNSDISFIVLTDEDISDCLNAGLNIGDNLGNVVLNPTRTAIKIKRSYLKEIGKSSADIEKVQADDFLNGRITEGIIHTLRLYRPGTVSTCGFKMANDNIFLMGSMYGFGLTHQLVPMATYKLGKTEINGLQDLYGQIMEVSRYDQKGFLVAVRRFSAAGERASAEDRIIDYLIAAEALFLTDDDAQELSYRLAHRAACALGDSPKDKRELFKQVKDAYRIRSKLVHGKEVKLQRPGKNNAAALIEFANELEDLLRKAIKRKLELAKKENVSVDKLNWNDIIF